MRNYWLTQLRVVAAMKQSKSMMKTRHLHVGVLATEYSCSRANLDLTTPLAIESFSADSKDIEIPLQKGMTDCRCSIR